MTKIYSFETNYDVSVILPFYKKIADFKITLEKNSIYFQRNGIEVIIVMDEASEQEQVLTLIKKFPLINWKVIVNDKPHEWRNPAKAINVAIKNASKKYILVMGPDSEMAHDIIFTMRKMNGCFERSFFVGRVAFVDYDYTYSSSEELMKLNYFYYGSIFVEREFLISIGGYDERYEKWGGDDDNIRARLQRFGLKKIKLPECILLHREHKTILDNSRNKEKNSIGGRDKNELRNSFHPSNYRANPAGDWGNDFSRIVYDWSNNIYAQELCITYLEKNKLVFFETKKDAFTQRYNVVALISAYNENQNIKNLLLHLDNYCDGIILLDDASEDDTYELAASEKLLIKMKKAHKNGFDDLSNRNMLLDVASFFKSSFYFFIDADERLDTRYSDLYSVAASGKSDTFCFNLIHLWDNDENYRIDVPESSQINQPGILQRWRMFKNIGRMQITGDKLHFEATPYKAAKCVAPILVRHYGMMSKRTRMSKYNRYKVEDDKLYANPDKYQYFLHDEVMTKPVSNIFLPQDSYIVLSK